MKNKEILPFVTWMNSGGIMLREVSQTEKDKCYVISWICGIGWQTWGGGVDRAMLVKGYELPVTDE